MKSSWIRMSALGLSALALVASPALARPDAATKPLPKPADTKPAAHPAGNPAAPTADDPMMQAWMKAMTPGMEHKKLAEMAGNWTTVVVSTMMPGAPAVTTKGTVTYKMMDDRFLHEDFHGEMMGKPFHGMGATGYDNVTKKYVSTWMDNMNTGIMTSTGTMAPDGTLTMTGEMADPMTGKMTKSRMVIKSMGADKKLFEMFGPGPDGKEFKMLEITYTRAK